MSMSEYNVSDIIDYAIDGNVVGVQAAVDDLMKDRIADVLAAKKIEVAKKFFNPED